MVVPGLPAILLAAPACLWIRFPPVVAGIGFGIGVGITSAVWGGFDWCHHDVDINVNHYNNINVNKQLNVNKNVNVNTTVQYVVINPPR